MRTSPREALLAVGGFAPLAVGLLWVLAQDLRPAPLYPAMTAADLVAVEDTEPVTLEWTPPRAPSALVVPVRVGEGSRLRVRIADAADDRELSSAWLEESTLAAPDLARVSLPELPATVRRLRVEFSSERLSGAPWILWAASSPQWRASVRRGGREVTAGGPLMLVEYPWPSRNALWLWLAAPPLALLALRRERGVPALLVALGLAALATSVLLWQRDYSHHFTHWDADEFGTYATTLARYLTLPASRAGGRVWMGKYIHAHNPLGPALMALPIALGIPAPIAYMALSAACSFVSLLIVLGMLRGPLSVSRSVGLTIVVLYACHLIFLRSFARPITDALGHLLTVTTLALLVGRAVTPSSAQLAGLAVLNLLHPLARPQGLAYVGFVTVAVIVLDAVRERDHRLRGAAGTLLLLGLAPLAVLAGLFAVFDWWTNARELLLVAERFRAWSTLHRFGWSLAGVLQVVPLLWLAAGRRWWNASGLVLAAWLVYYVAVMVAVRAPFWMRHFLPLLPAMMGLAGLAVDRLHGRMRAGGYALVGIVCAANVAAAVYPICDPTNLSLQLVSTFTLG